MNESRANSRQLEPSEKQELIHDPATKVDDPLHVTETPALSQSEKQKALDVWEADEEALQRAADEGMTGGVASRLADVKVAKQKLVK